MKSFKPNLAIKPTINPMGFTYAPNCFGPEVENRSLDAIRPSLMDPQCAGPEIVYSIAMDVGKDEHRRELQQKHLLFGVVTYAKGRLGKEPMRSQGHIHKRSAYAKGWSTPEVYQIWLGKAVIYMQEYAADDPGRCFAVYAEAGDIVMVPPSWAHATISADPETPLTFGAWCDRDYGFEYDQVRAHQGLAWYPLLDGSGEAMEWHFNENYHYSELIRKEPRPYEEFGVENQKCIYAQFEEAPEQFLFVPKPFLVEEVWEEFVP